MAIHIYTQPKNLKNHKDTKYILDTFAGSGSSFIASINKNKAWIGLELDTQYCDKIIRRYYDYTFSENIKIIRDGQTIPFEQIKEELNLLQGTTKKGDVTEQTRLF